MELFGHRYLLFLITFLICWASCLGEDSKETTGAHTTSGNTNQDHTSVEFTTQAHTSSQNTYQTHTSSQNANQVHTLDENTNKTHTTNGSATQAHTTHVNAPQTHTTNGNVPQTHTTIQNATQSQAPNGSATQSVNTKGKPEANTTISLTIHSTEGSHSDSHTSSEDIETTTREPSTSSLTSTATAQSATTTFTTSTERTTTMSQSSNHPDNTGDVVHTTQSTIATSKRDAPTTEPSTNPATTTYTTFTSAITTTPVKIGASTGAPLQDTTAASHATSNSQITTSTLIPAATTLLHGTTGHAETTIETRVTNGTTPPPTSSLRANTIEFDNCLGVTCQNNGICNDIGANYTCSCTPGWQGRHCAEEINDCLGVICDNNGSCIDVGNNYTCNCTTGWRGRHCTDDFCTPNPCAHGSCASNMSVELLYRTCTCDQGWTGPDCDEDVPECENTTICGNGFCGERLGSYECFCKDGWHGDSCNHDIDECKSSSSPCLSKPHSDCNNTEGSYECICNHGFVEIDQSCQKNVLWLGYNDEPRLIPENNTIYRILTDIPVPYFKSVSTVISVQGNGYVTFGDELVTLANTPTKTSWPFSPKCFGVYWADIEFPNNNQSFMYILKDASRLENATIESSLIKYVKKTVNDSTFLPLYAIMVTWENAMPRPAKDYPNDKATFQLIIATDGDISYAIRSYQTVWGNTGLSNRPFFSTVYSSEDGTRSDLGTPSNATGPDVVKLGTKLSGINNLDCIRQTQAVSCQLSAHNQSLPPCPCYKAQAANDESFKAVQHLSSTCYQWNSTDVADLAPQCCYDEYGLLITGSRDAYAPSPNDNSLQRALNACCIKGSRLCDWFNKQIHLPRCLEYIPPFIAGGFGDPHIVTFDNNKYSFNDVGDFVIFRSGDGEVEIQGRTKLSDNNQTATFIAYAVKIGNLTYPVLIQYTNGAVNRKSFDSRNYKIIIAVKNGVNSFIIQSKINDPNSGGLMGTFDENAKNDFKFSNGTIVEGSADHQSGGIINQFAESWRANKSLISISSDYKATYNQSKVPILPTSADDVIKQLNESNAKEAKNLCGDHLFCLQDFYINKNVTLAQAVLDEENSISLIKDFASQVPKFTSTQGIYAINISSPLTLKLEAADNKATNFSFASDFPPISGISLINNTFTWDINASLDILRKTIYPRKVVFHLTLNDVSSKYTPTINLCLCNQTSQCSNGGKRELKNYFNNDGSEKGNVNNVICDCGDRATGEYCEKEVDVCDNCYNTNRSECDASKTEGYCPPCPKGFGGDGIRCRDIDECAVNNGGCQQVCNNGNVRCSCWSGYKIDGNNCTDIDECRKDSNYCNDSLKYCTNSKGFATCSCYPGLVGDTTCMRAPYVFVGYVKLSAYRDQQFSPGLLIKSSEEFKYLAGKVINFITKALINRSVDTIDDFYIEILSFTNNEESYMTADFAIYTSNSSVTIDDINDALDDFVKPDCVTVCSYGDLLVFSDKPEIYVDYDATPCDYKEINHCDSVTTTCTYQDQVPSCKCNKGYKRIDVDFYSCTDIDECVEIPGICGAEKSDCSNTVGSYKCKCKIGQVWNETSLQCVVDKCFHNLCEHDGICHVSNNDQGYVCSCTYGWNGPLCGDEDTDARRMKIAVISVSSILGFCCLALLVITLVLCIKQRRKVVTTSNSDSYYSQIKPLPRQKDSQRSSTEMEENGQSNVYSRLNKERSSGKQTSFEAPASEAKKEGNATVYYNSAFDEEIVARL